jgi:hypothetical protein
MTAARMSIALAALAMLPACPCPEQRACPDNYANVALAHERAMYAVMGKYGSCFPPDYEPAAFFADLKARNVGEADIEYLRYATVDVWTEPDCAGFVYIARCPKDATIMLWDKSSTPALDGPGGANHASPQASTLPAHQPPTECACKAGQTGK